VTAPLDVQTLRGREFPWAQTGDVVYLNSASTGPLPERTRAATDAFNVLRAAPHRISDADIIALLARSRELVARLVNAAPAEIALATNTGFGINLAALALPIEPGQVVVVPDREFPVNMYPWMAQLPRRGASVRTVPVRDDCVDEEALLAALDEPDVAALAVSWVGFATGARVDLARLGDACRDRGIHFIVDAIQGLGPLTLDLARVHVDILACGAQKWLLSPWGSGFTYVRGGLIGGMEPPNVGWTAVKASEDYARLLDYDLTWRDDARRFELLTLPYQDFVGMNESLGLILELGPEAVSAHISGLAERVVSWARAEGISLVTPADPDRRAGIVAIRVDDAARRSDALRDAGVVHSLREGSIRLSPHCFNTGQEIDRALELLSS
jgi:cysteine desulfurase / selenocysteine lyase